MAGFYQQLLHLRAIAPLANSKAMAGFAKMMKEKEQPFSERIADYKPTVSRKRN
jgi:hypothetical protein